MALGGQCRLTEEIEHRNRGRQHSAERTCGQQVPSDAQQQPVAVAVAAAGTGTGAGHQHQLLLQLQGVQQALEAGVHAVEGLPQRRLRQAVAAAAVSTGGDE